MTDSRPSPEPSPFIARWVRRLAAQRSAAPRALDFACGGGRHALLLAASDYRVEAIDSDLGRLRDAQALARRADLHLGLLCADLTSFPLPRQRYEVVVVARYLDRERFRALLDTLAPGGVLLYETFTERQLAYPRGPRSPAHLLRPGELRLLTRGMDVLFDEEVAAPDAVARIAARRR